jgi:hypothetical protein
VELPPPFLPAGLHVLDLRARRRHVVGVGSELELGPVRPLLETLRKPLEPRRAGFFRALDGNANRDPLQRNALFSFSKNPSSCL